MAAQPWHGKMMGEIMTAVMIDGKRLEFPATVPRVGYTTQSWCTLLVSAD